MTRRLVILGATGRLGKICLHTLAHHPELDVVGQGRRSEPGLVHWDPAQGMAGLADLLEGADAVLNMIGTTPTSPGGVVDGTATNVDLACAIATTARSIGVGRILMVSSAAVYGPPPTPGHVFRECDAMRPATPYGQSKRHMEQALAAQAGPDLSILRIGNVAGADGLLGQVWGAVQPVSIILDQFPDGLGPRRSYIGPLGLGRAIGALACAVGPLPDVLNITAPPALAMDHLLEAWQARRPGTVDVHRRPAPKDAIADVTLCHLRLAAVMEMDLMPITAEGVVQELCMMEFLA